MKRSMVYGAVAASLLGFSMSASADFSGYYAPSNWTVTHLPDNIVDMGSVDTSLSPGSIKVIGSDTGVDSISEVHFTIAAAGAGTVSFNWAYHTNDVDGDAFFDPAGYLKGTGVQLSADLGGVDQSGTSSFSVVAGQTFGFYVLTNDNDFGNATLQISNFSAPVPEPSSIVMMALGLLGLVAVGKRRAR